jgi:hypothetical protein
VYLHSGAPRHSSAGLTGYEACLELSAKVVKCTESDLEPGSRRFVDDMPLPSSWAISNVVATEGGGRIARAIRHLPIYQNVQDIMMTSLPFAPPCFPFVLNQIHGIDAIADLLKSL